MAGLPAGKSAVSLTAAGEDSRPGPCPRTGAFS